ncbi:MAG: hypothetical protein VX780_00720 [Pseudomonadota bacterium]|nr:hypothetical protein [Pseudomonadota bacterium]
MDCFTAKRITKPRTVRPALEAPFARKGPTLTDVIVNGSMQHCCLRV